MRTLKWVVLAVTIAFVLAIGLIVLRNETIGLNGHEIGVIVADSEQERVRGLSGTERLGEGRGMLLVFDTDGRYGIWMKDMRYAIDIVWISGSEEVVHIERDVSPDTYPAVFHPPADARYVLELPAGSAEKYALVTGAKIEL